MVRVVKMKRCELCEGLCVCETELVVEPGQGVPGDEIMRRARGALLHAGVSVVEVASLTPRELIERGREVLFGGVGKELLPVPMAAGRVY